MHKTMALNEGETLHVSWQIDGGKAEFATCQWHVFSNDRSEAETGKEFRNGFEADLFL